MIRQATPEDFNQIAPLVMMASKVTFEDALKTKNPEQHLTLLKEYYLDSQSKFSYLHTIVYEIDNQIAGCCIYYPSSIEPSLNKKMDSYLSCDYQFPEEGIEGTIYIDSLAVSKKFRKQGIAQKLLSHIVKETSTNLSLLVDDQKKGVQRYYQHLGFQSYETVERFGTTFISMIYKEGQLH